ncbi:MAG: 50S ribosomal protein L15 [Actinobacteria bacterium]|jgi:large subunit ribosomal protein L15|nr:50S ribosomal protein L15 [Actinomycetota bacterium]
MIKLHDLAPAAGATKRSKRVGRGTAGRGGKTAGRGTKGQGARDTIPAGFEGGQLPLVLRIPKLKGFKNPFSVKYNVVNLDDISTLAGNGDLVIDPEMLKSYGLVSKNGLVKILGDGELNAGVTVSAHAFSASARAAIESKGGSAIKLDLPFGNGRPPAKGNALTNR